MTIGFGLCNRVLLILSLPSKQASGFTYLRSNRRRRFFVRQWGGNGTISTVDGSDVVFSSSF